MAGRVGVQAFVIGAGALVLGLVLGGLGPRAELREVQQELFDSQKKCANNPATQAGAELVRLLTQGMEQRRAEAAAAPSTDDAPDPDRASSAAVDQGDPEAPASDARPVLPPKDDLEAAKEMLEVRSHQARAALIEDAEPTADQLKVIDQALAEMNTQLLLTAQDFADRATAQGQMTRHDMMSFGAETLGLFVDAEDRIVGALSPEQRAAVREEATDPTSFVDPQIVAIFQSMRGLDQKVDAP